MDWASLVLPALAGGAASLVVALVTVSLQSRAARTRLERELADERSARDAAIKAESERWSREFAVRYAETTASNERLAEALRQQFAGAYLYLKQQPGQTTSDRRFIPVGVLITIGRGDQCDIQLDDPERLLSQVHAIIELVDSGATLTDVSTNGTLLNGRELTRGERASLTDGDEITFGTVMALFNTVDRS
ncbi:MAG: FHA domain-containing protein [Pseudomonadota bacterium]